MRQTAASGLLMILLAGLLSGCAVRNRCQSGGCYDQGPAISPYPVDVVIDRDGTIRAIFTEYDADALIEAVNDAL